MTEVLASNAALLLYWQETQEPHDNVFHSDIANLSPHNRLKHLGNHFGKYSGRFARYQMAVSSGAEPNPKDAPRKTVIDALLCALSAANVLGLDLQTSVGRTITPLTEDEVIRKLADYAGRFADGIEKLDHLEDGQPIAKSALLDIFRWCLAAADLYGIDDPDKAIRNQRAHLRGRKAHLRNRAA